jgi:RNA polymerase sigma-70 factor (ECF subfamily)
VVEVELGDAELALRIGSGTDREAEAELFRRMAPRIRLYGLRHLRDPNASDDLTQQVILTTLEALRAGACGSRRSSPPSCSACAG